MIIDWNAQYWQTPGTSTGLSDGPVFVWPAYGQGTNQINSPYANLFILGPVSFSNLPAGMSIGDTFST